MIKQKFFFMISKYVHKIVRHFSSFSVLVFKRLETVRVSYKQQNGPKDNDKDLSK